MFLAVIIPAKNEAGNIGRVLRRAQHLEPTLTVVVANGCTDTTIEEAVDFSSQQVHILEFQDALGIDVPRSIGAKYAHLLGADAVIFIDGDMVGPFENSAFSLIGGMRRGSDLALTNCYRYITQRFPVTEKMLDFRILLNRELELFRKLGTASPSHGPHGVSRRLLDNIGFKALAIPPVELALAKLHALNIEVHAAVPHSQLGSTIKNHEHALKVTNTIIGDCVEAINLIRGQPHSRVWEGVYYSGYNSERRWDLLSIGLQNLDRLSVK